MRSLEARGVELGWSERGAGPAVLLVHETATSSAAWAGVAEQVEALGGRAISYDRRGWGASGEPVGYARTTVEEQSEDAAALIEGIGAAPAVVCGAGLGAVIALDLQLRHPGLARAAVLVEPPLLALVPEATEMLSADQRAARGRCGGGPRGPGPPLPLGRARRAGGRRRAAPRRGDRARPRAPRERRRRDRRRRGVGDADPAPGRCRPAAGGRGLGLDAPGAACGSRGARGALRRSAARAGRRRGGGPPSAHRGPGRARSDRPRDRQRGSALISITPPRRASTAPPSSRTAMIAVGTAASTVTITSMT